MPQVSRQTNHASRVGAIIRDHWLAGANAVCGMHGTGPAHDAERRHRLSPTGMAASEQGYEPHPIQISTAAWSIPAGVPSLRGADRPQARAATTMGKNKHSASSSPAPRPSTSQGHGADRPGKIRKSGEGRPEDGGAPTPRRRTLYDALPPGVLGEGAPAVHHEDMGEFDLEALIEARVGALDRGAFNTRVSGKVRGQSRAAATPRDGG
jgi:hypothetical protein